jgi:hypothetical protein
MAKPTFYEIIKHDLSYLLAIVVLKLATIGVEFAEPD